MAMRLSMPAQGGGGFPLRAGNAFQQRHGAGPGGPGGHVIAGAEA